MRNCTFGRAILYLFDIFVIQHYQRGHIFWSLREAGNQERNQCIVIVHYRRGNNYVFWIETFKASTCFILPVMSSIRAWNNTGGCLCSGQGWTATEQQSLINREDQTVSGKNAFSATYFLWPSLTNINVFSHYKFLKVLCLLFCFLFIKLINFNNKYHIRTWCI